MKRKNSRCSQGWESDLKISTFGTQAMKQKGKCGAAVWLCVSSGYSSKEMR